MSEDYPFILHLDSHKAADFLLQNLIMNGYAVTIEQMWLVVDIFIDYLALACGITVQDEELE